MSIPSHPGTLLKQLTSGSPEMKTAMAEQIDISRVQFYDILNERKPVSPAIAAKLGRYFGNGTVVWLNMQETFDAWMADATTDLSRVGSRVAA